MAALGDNWIGADKQVDLRSGALEPRSWSRHGRWRVNGRKAHGQPEVLQGLHLIGRDFD